MRSCTWLTLGLLSCMLAPAALPAQNLLLNPSFEIDPVEDGIAPGWAKYRSGDGMDGWLKPWSGPDSDWVAVAGQWAPGQWVLWGQSVPCTPGKNVTFRIWSGGYPGFTGSTSAKLEFYYPNQEGGSMAIATAESSIITGTHPWSLQEISATVPAQAARVRAMGWIQGAAASPATGSAKFDDAYLETSSIPAMVTPGEAKGLADNTQVWLKWPVVVRDNGSDTAHTDCYVTGYHREGTVRVTSNSPIYSNGAPVAVRLGAMLHVVGTVTTVNAEKVVQASDVVPTNWDGPWPKAITMNTRSMSLLPDTSGLLARLVGNVSWVSGDKTFFYLDDGANVPAEGAKTGIKVYHTASPDDYPQIGDTVSATGIVWTEQGADSKTYYNLTTRKSSDFAVLNIGSGGVGRNLLLNPGFESGSEAWTLPDSSVAPEAWAALNGAKGMAFYTWDSYTDISFHQTVPNIVPGATYEFSAQLKEEPNHIGTIKMIIEWLDSSNNPIVPSADLTVDPPDNWGKFILSAVAPAGAASANFTFADTNHSPNLENPNLQAVMVDDTVAKITAMP